MWRSGDPLVEKNKKYNTHKTLQASGLPVATMNCQKTISSRVEPQSRSENASACPDHTHPSTTYDVNGQEVLVQH